MVNVPFPREHQRVVAVVVPSEYCHVLDGLPGDREPELLSQVWDSGYSIADALEVVWCVPREERRLPRIHAWRNGRHRPPDFTLRQWPRNDFYPLVGAEITAVRRRAPVIVWSHSGVLWADVARDPRGLQPVYLAGLQPGLYRVPRLRGEIEEVRRVAPRYFTRPPSTVRDVYWFAPATLVRSG